jgi:hypothetical protein
MCDWGNEKASYRMLAGFSQRLPEENEMAVVRLC